VRYRRSRLFCAHGRDRILIPKSGRRELAGLFQAPTNDALGGCRICGGALDETNARLLPVQRLRLRQVLTHPALLVFDEIDYLPISRTGAMFFVQLMTRRYEHASWVLTSHRALKSGRGLWRRRHTRRAD
jgi:hypothetical protein